MEGLIDFGGSTKATAAPRRSRRSKGCITCRKRKVKCDEAKPICERCRSGFHKCLGYDESRIFVNSGPGLDSQKSPSVASLDSQLTVAPSKRPLQQSFPIRSSPEASVALLSVADTPSPLALQDYTDFSAFNLMPDLGIPPTLSLDGFRDGIVISHLLVKFQALVEGNKPEGEDAPTLAGVLLNGDRQTTAYIAGLSIAEALFGRMHSDDELVRHSGILYGQALKRLQSDIRNIDQAEVRARSFMNLWSTTFLGLYEIMMASTPMSWLEHSRGLSALTQSLGPRAFTSASARRLFYSNRLFIATAGIATKKRTFLEQEEWKVIPWAELEPLPRPITILLQDIFCDIPGYTEDALRLMSDPLSTDTTRAQELSTLQAKIINSYVDAEFLRWQWEEEYPNVCWEVPVTPELRDAGGSVTLLPFATVLHFSTFDRAIDAIYFNVVRLLLYELASEVGLSPEALLPTETEVKAGPFSNATIPPGQGSVEGYALEICRTVHYLVTGDTDSLGTLALMFPLRVASVQLQHRPDVLVWLHWVLEKMTTKKGFKLGEHVMKMKAAKT